MYRTKTESFSQVGIDAMTVPISRLYDTVSFIEEFYHTLSKQVREKEKIDGVFLFGDLFEILVGRSVNLLFYGFNETTGNFEYSSVVRLYAYPIDDKSGWIYTSSGKLFLWKNIQSEATLNIFKNKNGFF